MSTAKSRMGKVSKRVGIYFLFHKKNSSGKNSEMFLFFYFIFKILQCLSVGLAQLQTASGSHCWLLDHSTFKYSVSDLILVDP
jgi:hypothetical protein